MARRPAANRLRVHSPCEFESHPHRLAHRKPLGTTWRGPIDWQGPLPQLRDYLCSTAGTWYRIVGIEETANPQRPVLVQERVADQTDHEPGVVLEHDGHLANVHPFWWYSRDKRRP